MKTDEDTFIDGYFVGPTVCYAPDCARVTPGDTEYHTSTRKSLKIVPPITEWTIEDGNAYTLGMKILQHMARISAAKND